MLNGLRKTAVDQFAKLVSPQPKPQILNVVSAHPKPYLLNVVLTYGATSAVLAQSATMTASAFTALSLDAAMCVGVLSVAWCDCVR